MEYQVWTKDEFSEGYTKVDCGDLDAAKREIDKAVRVGAEPILTVEVPYKLSIKIEEAGAEKKPRDKTSDPLGDYMKEDERLEAEKGKAKPDKGS